VGGGVAGQHRGLKTAYWKKGGEGRRGNGGGGGGGSYGWNRGQKGKPGGQGKEIWSIREGSGNLVLRRK